MTRPGGIASLIMMQLPVIRARRFGGMVLPYLLALGAGDALHLARALHLGEPGPQIGICHVAVPFDGNR